MGFVSWGVSSVTRDALSKRSEIKIIKTVIFYNKYVNPRENLMFFFTMTVCLVAHSLVALDARRGLRAPRVGATDGGTAVA